MSAETIKTFLINCHPHRQVEFRIASLCAPVLKGIKASNMINIPKGTWRRIRRILRESGIVCIPLFMGEHHDMVFLYRHERLAGHLKQPEVRRFLLEYGYWDFSVAGVIIRLSRRYQEYAYGEIPFPHELGVLLEYPVEDVFGFIRNHGENSLVSKYWKVYCNQEQAEQKFRQYDRAREIAMQEILDGYPLQQIAL